MENLGNYENIFGGDDVEEDDDELELIQDEEISEENSEEIGEEIGDDIIDGDNIEFNMECDDEELDPLEVDIEIFDENHVVELTDEQIAVNLLSLLSFNDSDVISHKEYWNRKTKSYIDILNWNTSSQNHKLYPVIKANRILVEDEDNVNEDETGTIMTTLDNILRKRTLIMKSKEPYPQQQKKLMLLEKTWEDKSDHDSVKYHVKKDTWGFIKSDDALHKVKLNGQSGRWDGDIVDLIGFVYIIHNDRDVVVKFDTREYVKSLENILVGDDVIVVDNYLDRREKCIVLEKNEDMIKVSTSDGDVTYDMKHLDKNTCFLYPSTRDGDLISKYTATKSNVLFTIVPNVIANNDIINMLVPSASEAILLSEDIMQTLTQYSEIKTILARFGWDVIDLQTFVRAKQILLNNTTTQMTKMLATKNKVVKKHDSEFKPPCDYLDFSTHQEEISDYFGKTMYASLNKTISDTDYARMKYITGQGDSGLLYTTCLMKRYTDQLFKYIQKKETDYVKETEKLKTEIEEIDKTLKTSDCDGFQPNIKKSYKNLEDLNKDNFQNLDGVENGDYAEVLDNDKQTRSLFKRVFTERNGQIQQFWIHDRDMIYDKCNPDGVVEFGSLEKQESAYDTFENICASKEYVRLKNKRHHLASRLDIIGKMLVFMENYDTVRSLQEETIHVLKTNIKSTFQRYSADDMSYEDIQDYSEFVGDANEDVDDKFAQAEQGQNIVYKPLQVEKIDQKKKDLSDDNYIVNILSFMGIDLSTVNVDFILRNVEIYNPARTLEANKASIMKKEQMMLHAEFEKRKKELKNVNEGNLLQVLKKKLQTIRESQLDKASKEFFTKSISIACAMFVILVQLNIDNVVITSAYQSCSNMFGLEGYPVNENNRSLLKYVACVVKNMSTKDNQVLGAFYDMNTEEIYNVFKKQVDFLLNKKSEIKQELELIKKRLKIRVINKNIPKEYSEWTSFRPYIPNAEKAMKSNKLIAQYITSMYDLSKTSNFVEKLTADMTFMSSFLKDKALGDTYAKLSQDGTNVRVRYGTFTFKQREDIVNMFGQKDIATKNVTELHLKVSEPTTTTIAHQDIKEAMDHIDDDIYWMDLEYTIVQRFEDLLNKMNIPNVYKERLFIIPNTQALKIKNSYRNALFNDIKILLGKVSNNWTPDALWLNRLVQLDKRKDEHIKINEILSTGTEVFELSAKINGDMEFKVSFSDVVSNVSQHLIGNYHHFEKATTDNNIIKRQIYIYNYILVEMLYMLLNSVLGGHDIYDLSSFTNINNVQDNIIKVRLQTMRSLIVAILSSLLNQLQNNLYDVFDVNRVQEQLREERKTRIIKDFERLDQNDKGTYKLARDLGLIKVANLDVEKTEVHVEQVVVKDDEADEVGLEQLHIQEEEKENEMVLWEGENDDGNNEDGELDNYGVLD